MLLGDFQLERSAQARVLGRQYQIDIYCQVIGARPGDVDQKMISLPHHKSVKFTENAVWQ